MLSSPGVTKCVGQSFSSHVSVSSALRACTKNIWEKTVVILCLYKIKKPFGPFRACEYYKLTACTETFSFYQGVFCANSQQNEQTLFPMNKVTYRRKIPLFERIEKLNFSIVVPASNSSLQTQKTSFDESSICS